MADKRIIKQWISLADDDLRLAEHTANTLWPTPIELVCFHCQQAAEKYLKGFLEFNNEIPRHIHDLIALRKMCEVYNPNFNYLIRHCQDLTAYSVQPRYSHDLQLEKEDMVRALTYVKDLKDFLLKEKPELFD
jgi:HEPN domain-containing protein